jgi:hypothetical protein
MSDPQVTPHGSGGAVVAGDEGLAGQAFRFAVFTPGEKNVRKGLG